MKTSIRTVFDAGQERRDETALALGRAIGNQSKQNLERATLALYPEIGTLTRKGSCIFYTYPTGGEYYESAELDQVCRHVDGGKPRIVRVAT